MASPSSHPRPLSSLSAGTSGVVAHVLPDIAGHAERLHALGVTPGALVQVLQTFPGIVFQCDQTELAVERAVGHLVLVAPE
ncbi:MAG: ferrous iron transport protein A [Acidobacteria bacterium]|nr:ferrous iron transport protein A [Acidobacteriota bacterium]